MRAVVLDRTGGPEVLEWREVPEPVVGPDDVLVRVRASGVCGRDVIDRRGGFPAMKLPVILGHEFAGEVVSVGNAVTAFAVGDRVANLHRPFCGACDACVSGEIPDCTSAWQSFGHTIDGGYAELVAVPEKALVAVPSDIGFTDAASVGCTAAVALRALRHEAGLQLGETVLITGASGGVGMQAIQIAKAMGARVIALTSAPSEKAAALRGAGADDVISSADSFHETVRSVSGGGVDVALELTGSATFEGALRSLRRRGRLVIVGNIRTEKVRFNPGALLLQSLRILGSHGFTPSDLGDCFRLMQKGGLRTVISRTLPLERAADAHVALANQAVVGRIILVP
jgi:NADPH:quinone reductase-like Zn-dependent oxidoreductase